MNDIFLDNDYFISYFMGDRTQGTSFSGLQLEAILSTSPTGSAVTSSCMSGPTASLQAVAFTTSLVSQVLFQTSIGFNGASPIIQSYTQSILFEISESLTSFFSGNVPGLQLRTTLAEVPPCSAEYAGVFFGGDISTALSASFSTSFGTATSSSINTGSFSGSFVSQSATLITSFSFITMSVSGFTSSLTTSTAVPLVLTAPRSPGLYEIITSGSHLKIVTPLTIRAARFVS